MTDTCQNLIDGGKCHAMPKQEIDLKFETIIEKLTTISADSKEIKSILQQQAIDAVGVKKDIERIDKERTEDKEAHEKDIDRIEESIKSRDKKQMWFSTLIVAIGGVLATVANFFINK